MKTILTTLLQLGLFASVANAQLTSLSPTDANPAPARVIEAGPHYRVIESVSIDSRGDSHTNKYTELATGLNYFNRSTGQWEESQPRFEITSDGNAVSSKTLYGVAVAANLNSQVAIHLVSPDDIRFQSHVLGLSYFDPVSGKSVLIAEVKDAIGELVAPDTIIYPDAFTDILADYRVTLTKAGVEADVILRQQPPSPAEYSLPPETTHLQVLTEYIQPPTPVEQAGTSLLGTNPVPTNFVIGPNFLTDERLSFGSMSFGQGRAFSVDLDGLNARQLNDSEVPVGKMWATLEGRQFLVESLNYLSILPHLELLPEAPKTQASSQRLKYRRVAMNDRVLPKAPKLQNSKGAMRVAKSGMKSRAGFVVDWVLLGSATNQTFHGDSTYYVSGTAILSGTTTLEGGSVLKYTNGATTKFQGPITCLTSPYRPAIFTSKDDNTVGETISGSTGVPTNYYAGTALYIDNNRSDLRNVRISYATQALYYDYDTGYPHQLSHAQLVHCQKGIIPLNTTFTLRNVLMYDVKTNFYASSYAATGQVEHLTVDVTDAVNASTNISLLMTNCVFAAVTNIGTISGCYNATNTTGSGVFQTVGAGAHYLAASSSYRNTGTTIISSQMSADLMNLTTYPPLVLTNAISVATTLAPQAQRDFDQPDLGYHYWPIDYAVNGLVVTNATLILTNSVALAAFGTNGGGVSLQAGSQLISEGAPLRHNHLIRYMNVQELFANWGGPTSGFAEMIHASSSGSSLPVAQLHFTDFDGLSACGYHISLSPSNPGDPTSWELGSLLMRDCSVSSGAFYLEGDTNASFVLNNNLFDRVSVAFMSDWNSYSPIQAPELHSYNNLFRYGTTYVYDFFTNHWEFKDNSFDSTSLTFFGGPLNAGNNAWINMGTNRFYPTNANDQVLAGFTYAAGPLGNYYQVSTNLCDAGSRGADAAGLYHYTAQVGQTKETNSTVDIGLHYVVAELSTNNLVGWWKLDESTGTLARDSSGYGHDGTLLNGPTWTTGKLSGGLSFDGSNDSVSCVESPALRLSADMTVAFWMKKNANTSCYARIVGKGSLTVRNYGIWTEAGTSRLLFQQHDGTGYGYDVFTTNSIATGTWYHVAGVVSGQTAYLYINGALNGSITRTGNIPTTSDPVTFGLGNASCNSYFPGLLDDVRIYNRALTPGEIAALFNSTKWDADGDGIPDCLEDRNGNGAVDSGETDWQSASDIGLRVWITEPKGNSNLP